MTTDPGVKRETEETQTTPEDAAPETAETTAAEMTAPEAIAPAPVKKRRMGRGRILALMAVGILAIDILSMTLVPPFPKEGKPGDECAFPACFVTSTIEMPPPAVVLDLQPDSAPHPLPMIYFHPSISNTILTMWIVMALILVIGFASTRRMKLIPGRMQNVVEWAYEFGRNFSTGLAGEKSRPYYPIFAGFFLLILFSNWSGLVPPVGRIEELRAPTSDVNITIGLALTSFCIFQFEGFRRLGFRHYMSKFFPVGEFRKGVGAGLLAMYIGFIELFLELVKPVTLAMRLFGNIYGGEVALAVITALTLAIVPVSIIGLEALLNLIQALIFSVLTLVFIVMAVEGHGEEEHSTEAGHNEAPGGAEHQSVAA